MMVLWREIRGLLRGGLRKRESGREGKVQGFRGGGTMGEQPPLGIPVLLFTVFLFQLLHLHGADL